MVVSMTEPEKLTLEIARPYSAREPCSITLHQEEADLDRVAREMPTVGLGLCWEDTPVGMLFKTVGRTVTEADITGFVGVTGMTEVLFTNLEYLRNESLFEGRLVPGALVFSFAEGLL